MVKKTAKLIHKNKIILDNLKYATGNYEISRGLMFKGIKKIKKGICLVMPSTKDVKFGASVTMLFCFHPMEILFVNSKFEVVDKKILKPWRPSYTPKAPCKYVFESEIGTFKEIKINDKIKLDFNK